MSRISDHDDRHFGPITIAPYRKTFELYVSSGGGYCEPRTNLRITGFGWTLRLWLPNFLKPYRERYDHHPRTYGVTLSDMGGGYDFLQVHYGPQTHDSRTTKNWSRHLSWKQWRCVRNSVYTPDGAHFATEEKGKWDAFYKTREECPKSYFGFEDCDGDMRIASCIIEEREHHRGDGWFKWLSIFSPAKIYRSLWFEFDYEVGPGKGSWKGGTCATGISMLPGEDPETAFRRWCSIEHDSRGRKYKVRFIGKSKPPEPHEIRVARNLGWHQHLVHKTMWIHTECPLCPNGTFIIQEAMLAYIKAERDQHNAAVSSQIGKSSK